MAVAKKKQLTYKGQPLYRVENTLYYGNLGEPLILAVEVLDAKKIGDVRLSTKVQIKLMENSGELGSGQVYRQTERENLYKALDIGAWWLQDALASLA